MARLRRRELPPPQEHQANQIVVRPEQEPVTEKKEVFKARLGVVDVSDAIETEARERAERSLTEQPESRAASRLGKVREWFGRTWRGVWKGNLMREYYRQKEIAVAKADIRASGNLYAGAADKAAHDAAMGAIVERFVNDYDDEVKQGLIHTEAGESVAEFESDEDAPRIKAEFTNLIKAYANGDIDATVLRQVSRNTFERLRQARAKQERSADIAKVVGEGEMYADNLLEIAEQVRGLVEHGQSLDELDIDLDITLGRAKAGVRTETQANAIGDIAKKMTDSKFGGWVSGMVGAATTETAVASALSVVYSAGAFMGQRVARSKLLAAASFGGTALLAGGIAAWRERKQLDRERRLHARERAKSATYVEGRDRRREEMEGLIYETRSAGDAASEMESLLFMPDEYGNNAERELTPEERQLLTALVADVDARVAISDRHKLDLLSYNSAEAVEQERLRLDILRAQAKVRLGSGTDGEEIKAILERAQEFRENQLLSGEVKTKNDLFNKMRRKGTAKAFVKGVVIGVAVGATVQEIGAAFSDKHGLVDLLRGKGPVQGETMTGLAYLKHWFSGDLPKVSGSIVDRVAGYDFKIPDGMDLQEHADGTLTLTANGQTIVRGLELDSTGHFTTTSADALAKHGIHLSEADSAVARTVMSPGTMGAKDFVDANAGDMHEVSRDLWYGNDTPMYTDPLTGKLLGADHNELRLLWGGENATGMDASGNFVFDVGEMTKDGSWQGVFSTDAQNLMQEGKMRLLLSVNDATQNRVFEVPIDADGKAIIAKGSLIARALFQDDGGKARFLGRFAEVAQVTHTDDAGVDHVRMLATHLGKGIDTFTGEVPRVVDEIVPITALDVPSENVLPPPVIPIWGRKALERMSIPERSSIGPEYGGASGEGIGLLDRSEYRKRMSEELREDRNFDTATNETKLIETYLDSQTTEHREVIEDLVQGAPPMKPSIEVVITVPAYQEEDNIEKTIEKYAAMEGHEKFEIVIFENHPTNKPRDKTGARIKKMQAKFPDLNIVHLYKGYEEKVPIGHIRKDLVDAVLLRKQKAGLKKSIAIVSNDADLEDINPEYANIVADAFSDKRLDALGGKWDFPRDAFEKMPLLHIAQRLWQFFDIAFRRQFLKSPELIGRNSAFRAGTYAAVGGYNPEARVAEDLEIGWLVKQARGYDPSRIKYNNRAWIHSNPRRAASQLASGGRLVHQYGDFHVNEEVRKASLEDVYAMKRDTTIEDVQKEVQATYDFYARWRQSKGGWISDEVFEKVFDRAMRFLGVRYEVREDQVVLTDTKKLKEGLDKYRGVEASTA